MLGRMFKGAMVCGAVMTLAGCVSAGGGTGGMSGSAGGSTSVNAAANLPRCDQPLGTLAVDDGRSADWWGPFSRATQITTVEPMIRLIVAQSNCFVITSVGNSRLDSRMQGITDQQRNGEYRAGSKQQKGQRVAADYFMEPAILFASANTGGLGAAVGGALLGPVGGALGGMMNQKSTAVTLSLFDIRSSVQIGISTGNATATDFGAALGALGGSAGGVLGGYKKTPEGEATVVAFVDAYSEMVAALKNYKAQTVKGGLGTGGTLKVQ
ncbi:hypothetical protein J2847_000128 [Azospirillum agricola]|uniref:hypothetical protein n=1 Tax=Azospirillum agricola TaxID=1720247 RepID=UPI001AE21EC3|nr:hypothetical protein [Azospirillum agricola]MBP2226861.1 hypothetical protein [Azospirillum agricola]